MSLVLKLLDFLSPYGMYAYVGVFALLLACGFGFPMPEDIILVTGGILSARGIIDLWALNVICMLGVLVGDGTIFMIGRRVGPKIKKTKFFAKIMPEKREKKV